MNKPWRSAGAGAALILVLTAVAYLPALRCGFIWDDDFYVTTNPALRSLQGLERTWTQPGMELHQYYPLAFTGLWVQYHLWNLQPFGYHLVNVLLHAVNAVLLWLLLRRVEVPGSWWAAAIFALHPVQVESVAWITEFKNVVSGLFSLLSLLAFLRFCPLSAPGTTATRDWRFYGLALLLFVCALLSKTAVCCLPVAVAALMWWKLDRVGKRDALALVPWFIASLTLGLITVRVESPLPKATPRGWLASIIQRGLLAGRALWFYAGKLFWPHPLTFIYPRWNVNVGAAWQYLFPVGALAVAVALWLLRRRIGKGPLAGVLWFAAMLAPALGFFDIYFFRFSYVADHFQYLASIGLIALTVSAGATFADRAGRQVQNLGALAAGVVLLALGVSTWRRAHVYRDVETLWRDTLAKNPKAWIAHNNLGYALRSQGNVTEAIWHFEQTLRLEPNYVVAHYNLGAALATEGKLEEAIGQYEQALRLKPDYADVRKNLGIALLRVGRTQEAIEQFQLVLQSQPDAPDAHNNLGYALLKAGRFEAAIEQLEQAVRINPDFAEAHHNLGLALMRSGRAQEAANQWDLVLRLEPNNVDAHYNLGSALRALGKVREAIKQYELALRLKPDFADAHNNLGSTLMDQGEVQAAIGHYEQALKIDPDMAEAHYNLALALRQAGRLQEAIGQYNEALRLRPDYAEAHNNLANALLAQGQVSDAIAHWEQALRLKPDYANAHYNLATALERVGRLPEAIGHYEQALRLKPDFAEAHQALMRLQATVDTR
ncbi:MAG TPA: tetratricopeptide repeat protein [Verrucomicrobiae bacterium]|nr:tetratricopeptide repeat protein [Verrucomicrobiae bacterium]